MRKDWKRWGVAERVLAVLTVVVLIGLPLALPWL